MQSNPIQSSFKKIVQLKEEKDVKSKVAAKAWVWW